MQFDLITIKQLAEQLGKPQSTIYSWKDKGNIPSNCFKQIGGSWFVKVKVFQEWVNA